jgi:prepilin-type N-terminal cleavage/methylation domain-containing protein
MYLFLKKLKGYKLNRGMSYVELIVVLSIFSVLSTLVMFNYTDFQDKINIKNLASDIALKIAGAQKASIFGKFPSPAQQGLIDPVLFPIWKPSYGLYFDLGSDDKSFIYFVDLNNNDLYEGTDCTGECIDKISITNDNFISSIDVVYQNSTLQRINDLTLSFVRPNVGAVIKTTTSLQLNVSHILITIISPRYFESTIKLYLSGRIEIN